MIFFLHLGSVVVCFYADQHLRKTKTNTNFPALLRNPECDEESDEEEAFPQAGFSCYTLED